MASGGVVIIVRDDAIADSAGVINRPSLGGLTAFAFSVFRPDTHCAFLIVNR